jgi:hypothetical protein
MSICKHCSGIGGFHYEHCPVRHYAKPYVTIAYPRKRETRVEWFGKLQVHQPVKP